MMINKLRNIKGHYIYLVVGCVVLYLIYHFVSSRHVKEIPQTVVSISLVVQRNVNVTYQTIGTVQAYSSVEIKSMVTGPLISAGFKEGDIVNKDQVLFQIDPRQFADALDQAKAALARDQAILNNNNDQVKRNTPLVKKGYVDKQSYDTLVSNAKSLEATVLADQAAIESAQLNLNYATIRAPISGKTGNITLKPGSVIKANDTTPLVTINQINPIYVAFSIPSAKLGVIQDQLRKGDVVVRTFVNKTTIEQGKLVFIDNAVDTATGTIQLKAEFQNEDHRLWPGQYVTVDIGLENIPQAILVPSLAVLTAQKGFYVYVVDENSIAHIRYIKVGPSIADSIVIESGVQAGERVITAGQLRVNDGAKVKIVQ